MRDKMEETKVEKTIEVKNSESNKSKFIIIASIMIFFLGLQGYFFGVNDKISLILVCITSFLLFLTIHKIHISSREILRVNTPSDSKLHKFLTGKSFSTIGIALIVSFITSTILITMLKGMIINSWVIMILVVVISSIFITFTSKNFKKEQQILNNNLVEEVSSFANKMIVLFIIVLSFNFIISLLISLYDINIFLKNEILLSNFEEYAMADSIENNGSNFISKTLINLYLFVDNLKMGFTNFIFSNVLKINKIDYFFISFLTILFFNFLKMLAFSFPFIYLQMSIMNLTSEIETKFMKKRDINETI